MRPLRRLARKDLPALQAALGDLPLSLRTQAQTAIYERKLREDFKTALVDLQQEPAGFDILSASLGSFRKVPPDFLDSFSSLPQSWQTRLAENSHRLTQGMNNRQKLSTDWETMGLTDKQVGRIRSDSLYDIIQGKNEIALKEFQAANLNPDGTRRLLDMLGWNQGEEIIAELLPHLDQETQEYVAKKEQEESNFTTPAFTNTAELSEGIAQEEEDKGYLLERQLMTWNEDQIKQFAEDYQAMEGEERQNLSALLATSSGSFSNLNLETWTQAVEDAISNPDSLQQLEDNRKNNLTSNISKVALAQFDKDPTTATTWVQNLPEGEGRQYAMKKHRSLLG